MCPRWLGGEADPAVWWKVLEPARQLKRVLADLTFRRIAARAGGKDQLLTPL